MHVRLSGVGLAADLQRFRRLLGNAGVTATCDHEARISCPALIYFTDTSAELLVTVRAVSNGGAERVLAVAGPDAVPTDDLAWQLVHAGASDVLAWDSCSDPVQAIVARLERWRQVDDLIASDAVSGKLVGTGAHWVRLLRQIVEVARFTCASALITGESGTGKELVARLIHQLDTRPDKGELVVLDCATVVPTLSGSEFFGHEKGAFTGAAGPRDGAFALANRGTLFLDEVGELSPQLQAELLRVIQEGMYKRIGSNAWRTTDFRLVCATNRDLVADQAAGRFRLDLYYRIAAWQFRLPPLRHRREDIELLALSFLARSRDDGTTPELEPAVRAFLRSRDYPGNVRDLRQLVDRISQRHVGCGPVTVGDVPDDDRPDGQAGAGGLQGAGASPWHVGQFEVSVREALAQGADLKEITRVAADTAVSVALAESGGSLQKAARSLGVTPRALQLRRATGRTMLSAGHDAAEEPIERRIAPFDRG
jgi:transcriptional regulator with GAF, ATPase, and Fis domain